MGCYKGTIMSSTLTVGFLGCGRMATALAKGFLRSNLVRSAQLIGSDPVEETRGRFGEETGGQVTVSNRDVLCAAEVIVLAVKPDQALGVLEEVRSRFEARHLLLSVAAGVPLGGLEAALGGEPRVVRAMPNAPALVGMSATGFAIGRYARPEDGLRAQGMFAAVGLAFEVKEGLLDAVTGLSGSGPAYACLIMEALSDGGVAAGLPREMATRLAAQTLKGSAAMVLETGVHPAVLREMVTSPGGTTIEGLSELESAGVRGALMAAVRAAVRRSRRLGRAGAKRGVAGAAQAE
jgi:pyrroline-5-carboxylate reductase